MASRERTEHHTMGFYRARICLREARAREKIRNGESRRVVFKWYVGIWAESNSRWALPDYKKYLRDKDFKYACCQSLIDDLANRDRDLLQKNGHDPSYTIEPLVS